MIGYSIPRASCGLSFGDAFSQALTWIQECIESHTNCVSTREAFLPTRVLDVGISEADTVKLYETRNEKASYICLSHCWGNVSFLKTEKRTLEDHKRGIPWSSFTKTFQDAITVARRLQIRWLWIDALCIIQDDDLDWTKESANMASIYEDAYITISATGAKDGNGGLFSPEMDHELVRYSIEGNEWCVRARAHLSWYWYGPVPGEFDGGGSFGFESSHWYSDILSAPDSFPILYRGWCFQERILSPRVLHFGHREMLWECRTKPLCECGGLSYCPNLKMDLANSLIQGTESEQRSQWHHIVEAYSRLSLTKSSDRLPAISGLAKRMQMKTTDYLAGAWRQHLLHDLLWQRLPGQPISERTAWIAPSWSWAAANTSVKFCGPETFAGRGRVPTVRWYTTIQSAKTTLRGSDPTGQVVAGSLTVKGPVTMAGLSTGYRIEPYTNSTNKDYIPFWKHTIQVYCLLSREEERLAASSSLPVHCLGIVMFEHIPDASAYDHPERHLIIYYLV
ncbi:heterokaryon incompatibility protein domain-containing protein [Trichoderma sp. SZMC 28013]